jgi:glycerophosphoryl diester phosphodiesterase
MQCDVVATKDCHLICRHEPELNLTTNAGDLYPKMFRTYNIDGTSVTVSGRRASWRRERTHYQTQNP